MRTAILGVAFGSDDQRLRQMVTLATEITHRDPRAFHAALAVAAAAGYQSAQGARQEDFLARLADLLPEPGAGEFHALAARALDSARRGEDPGTFAAAIGSRSGISGYCYHTVPWVLQAWFRYFRPGLLLRKLFFLLVVLAHGLRRLLPPY